MSTLNLRPEYQLASDLDSAHGMPALEQAALDGHERDSTPLRGARRRPYGTRLRMPSYDGFHLFRVY
ncbi:MAG: hypothetical protein WB646_21055 [Steroidobacteraceae bacterium]